MAFDFITQVSGRAKKVEVARERNTGEGVETATAGSRLAAQMQKVPDGRRLLGLSLHKL